MATLYSYTSTNNNTGWNWNGANDNGAMSFTPTVSGTPTEFVFRIESITGTPTGNVFIKSNKTLGSTTLGQALGVTFTSGTNTIPLTSGVSLTAGVQYWVFIERTSNISNFFRFYNEYTSPPAEQYWISSAPNIDPDIRYDAPSKNIGASMDINGTIDSGPVNLKTVDGLVKASTKTVMGLAMASIKTYDGLT